MEEIKTIWRMVFAVISIFIVGYLIGRNTKNENKILIVDPSDKTEKAPVKQPENKTDIQEPTQEKQ